jgi:hypothetical protein
LGLDPGTGLELIQVLSNGVDNRSGRHIGRHIGNGSGRETIEMREKEERGRGGVFEL